ncbi:MAG: hypothetical protein KDD60_08270, partial [Bdellovibrionales bacterium]|nr:hypothetical protein [Bdellovibrionales bacterium]
PYTALYDLAPAHGYTSYSTFPLLSGDWNGDGFTDISRYGTHAIKSFPTMGDSSTLVRSITDGLGKKVTLAYEPLTSSTVYSKGSGTTYPAVDIQNASRVVSTVQVSDGIGGNNTVRYHYDALRYEHNGRGSCGFQAVTATDETQGTISSTSYYQNHPYKGLTKKEERFLTNGTLLERASSTWTKLSLSNGRYYPYVSQKTEERFDLDGTPLFNTQTALTIDQYGNNLTSTTTYNDGYTDASTHTYNNNTAQWRIGELLSITTTKRATGKVAISRRSSFTYEAGRGLLFKENIEPGDAQLALTKQYGYDKYGNITSTTISGAGIVSRTSTQTYDEFGRFVIKKVNPLGHQESIDYDERHGQVSLLTGPNGLSTAWNYDTFGRAIKEVRSDGTETTNALLLAAGGTISTAKYFSYAKETGSSPSYTYYDALGREVRRETRGLDSRKIFVDTEYDTKGNVKRVSDPYFEGTSPLWSTTTYDALNRPLTMTMPGGRISRTNYQGFSTTATNPKGQVTRRIVNSRGKLVEAIDAQSKSVKYEYDSLENPTRVIDPLGNATAFVNDRAGRRISITDPDSGTTHSTYNALGELTSQRDAKGQIIRFTYDLLGRITSKTTPEGVSQWVYDSAPNGIGKLAFSTGIGGYELENEYDDLGRPAVVTKTLNGIRYRFGTEYDSIGRLSEITYPTGFSVLHRYNTEGFLVQVENGATGQSYWRADRQNARGLLEQQTLGNGLQVVRTYDSNTGYISRIRAGTH